jgi:hypothetical protein
MFWTYSNTLKKVLERLDYSGPLWGPVTTQLRLRIHEVHILRSGKVSYHVICMKYQVLIAVPSLGPYILIRLSAKIIGLPLK